MRSEADIIRQVKLFKDEYAQYSRAMPTTEHSLYHLRAIEREMEALEWVLGYKVEDEDEEEVNASNYEKSEATPGVEETSSDQSCEEVEHRKVGSEQAKERLYGKTYKAIIIERGEGKPRKISFD